MLLTDLLLGAALSGLVGFLLAIPAIVTEWRENGTKHALPILMDIKPTWGNRHLTHRELFFVALALHLVLATLFGALYVLFVELGWFRFAEPYTFVSLLVYAMFGWIVTGAVVFPLLQFGWFGRKEDGLVWAETLLLTLVLGSAMWMLMQWFQPAYFTL